MKNIRFVPLDDEGNPVLELSQPLSTAEFSFELEEDTHDQVDLSTLTQTTEWTTALTVDQETFDLLAGVFPPQPRWILENGEHKLEIWNLREGERGPDGRIPYHFDGRFLCGPHDEEGNHL
jgi:hypothetical protein